MQKNWLSLWINFVGAFAVVIGSAGILYSQANDWTEPFPPFKIAGNIYYVGSKGLANYLITTPQGHLLINSDLEQNVALIRASVERLGFKLTLGSRRRQQHYQKADWREVHGHGRRRAGR